MDNVCSGSVTWRQVHESLLVSPNLVGAIAELLLSGDGARALVSLSEAEFVEWATAEFNQIMSVGNKAEADEFLVAAEELWNVHSSEGYLTLMTDLMEA
jgi:hypothetical protein